MSTVETPKISEMTPFEKAQDDAMHLHDMPSISDLLRIYGVSFLAIIHFKAPEL